MRPTLRGAEPPARKKLKPFAGCMNPIRLGDFVIEFQTVSGGMRFITNLVMFFNAEYTKCCKISIILQSHISVNS